MAIIVSILGALLFVVGFGSLAMSVDLLPTDMGRLYVESGVAFLCASAIVFAIAALIHKLDRIVAPQRKARTADAAPSEAAPQDQEAWLDDPSEPALRAASEEDANRADRAPSLSAVEQALATPEKQPEVIGRYSAGGARYDVFSDGSIETETEEGGLRFPSMAEFKAYVASRKR